MTNIAATPMYIKNLKIFFWPMTLKLGKLHPVHKFYPDGLNYDPGLALTRSKYFGFAVTSFRPSSINILQR